MSLIATREVTGSTADWRLVVLTEVCMVLSLQTTNLNDEL
jgi:hypothetical protein